MKHLVNLLVGIGSVLSAFGTAPMYHKPASADRAKDLRNIRGDLGAAGTSLTKATKKAERKYGAINHRAT